MTILKNSDRDEIVRRILVETFYPRFSALLEQVRVFVQAKVEREHPDFVACVKNPALRPYLAITRASRIYLLDGDDAYLMASPVYGRRVDMPATRVYFGSQRENYCAFKDDETAIPCNFGDVKISEGEIPKAYRAAWADYSAAYDKLYALLRSYNAREKFATDFPEFAKYLPGITVKSKLPVVITKDVRAQLSRLGIPAQ